MLENGVITRLQLWLLVINFTIGSALLIIPTSVVIEAKQDAWISMLIAILFGIIIQFVLVTLANMHPKKTMIEICEFLFGKILGKIIGLLYALFFLHLASLVLRNAVDFIETAILPETPAVVFTIMLGFLLLANIKYGLEVVGRSNEIFTFVVVISFWFTIILVTPLMDIENIKPILANGFKPILRGVFPVIGFPYAELVVFLMFLPFVNYRENLKKIFISGGIVGGLNLLIVTFISVLVLGVNVTSISVYPTYNLARLINIGDFLTRLESFIALSYIIVIFIKLSATFYAGILALSQVFNISDYRSILFPTIIIVISLSIILNENIVEVITFASTTWTPYAMIFGFVMPLIFLALSLIKKRKKQ